MKRLVADAETAAWLATRPAFLWDKGNSGKSEKKHGVSCAEAGSLLERVFVLAGRVVSPVYAEPRWVLFGETDTGRRDHGIHSSRLTLAANQLSPNGA